MLFVQGEMSEILLDGALMHACFIFHLDIDAYIDFDEEMIASAPYLMQNQTLRRLRTTLTKSMSVGIEKNELWDIVCFRDSDCASDVDTRISVSLFILFILGVSVSWRSKVQRSMTLSSSEAE